MTTAPSIGIRPTTIAQTTVQALALVAIAMLLILVVLPAALALAGGTVTVAG